MVASSLWYGVVLAFVASLLLVLNALRIGSCAGADAIAYLALGPGIGVPIAGLLGALVAASVPHPRMATACAGLIPVAFAGVGIAEVIATPAVFVYSELVGWFPGALYDENTGISDAYISYRATSALLGIAVVSMLAAWLDPASVQLRVRLRSFAGLASGIGFAALYIGLRLHGAALGHRSDVASIRDALGGSVQSARCEVIAPRELDRASLRRLAEDCDFRVVQAEKILGVLHPARITAFFFRSADEKRRWMGAADTYIAKPWRDEVYLQLAPFPHLVLAHEIAHVVAGATSAGLFRVSGPLGGWLPDPSIIEGLAVAVAWDESDGLTPHEWAQAMIARDAAPPLSSILGGGFYGESSARAYTLAGSFFRFLLDTRGSGVLRSIYRTGDIARATGEPLDRLNAAWRAYLARRPLPPSASELAALRFSRGGIFSRPCPHRTAALRKRLSEDLTAQDDPRAIRTCRSILTFDPADVVTRAVLASSLSRDGRTKDADEERRIAQENYDAARPLLARIQEALADAAWMRGDRSDAARLYQALLHEPMTRDAARVLEVKHLGVLADERTSALLRDLLAKPRPPEGALAVHLAHALRETRLDGLPAYLEARQLLRIGDPVRAYALCREAIARRLPTDNVAIEARHMAGESAYLAGDLDAAEHYFQDVASDARLTEGERVDAADWIARIAFRRASTEPDVRSPDRSP